MSVELIYIALYLLLNCLNFVKCLFSGIMACNKLLAPVEIVALSLCAVKFDPFSRI